MSCECHTLSISQKKSCESIVNDSVRRPHVLFFRLTGWLACGESVGNVSTASPAECQGCDQCARDLLCSSWMEYFRPIQLWRWQVMIGVKEWSLSVFLMAAL